MLKRVFDGLIVLSPSFSARFSAGLRANAAAVAYEVLGKRGRARNASQSAISSSWPI